LTDGKGIQAGADPDYLLVPGSKMEDAEEGTYVQTFCTQLTGLEMWKCRSSTLANSVEGSVLDADFKPFLSLIGTHSSLKVLLGSFLQLVESIPSQTPTP
jgi:hypothetical protein